MSFMFFPQPVSGIIFDKTVKKKKNQNKTKQTNKQKQQKQKLLLNWLVKGSNGASSLIIDFFLLEKFVIPLFQPTLGNHAMNLTRTFSSFVIPIPLLQFSPRI